MFIANINGAGGIGYKQRCDGGHLHANHASESVRVQDVMAHGRVISQFGMIGFSRRSRHEVVRIVEGSANGPRALLRLRIALGASPLRTTRWRSLLSLKRSCRRRRRYWSSGRKWFPHGTDSHGFTVHHFQIDLDLVLGPILQRGGELVGIERSRDRHPFLGWEDDTANTLVARSLPDQFSSHRVSHGPPPISSNVRRRLPRCHAPPR